jgi:tRNA nucleotidyltransferase (CCA-adding enzyme)
LNRPLGAAEIAAALDSCGWSGLLDLFAAIAAIADSEGADAYLVGGAVRDLFLNTPFRDIDIVVEGAAPRVARKIASQQNRPCKVHDAFGTAEVNLESGLRVDFASARREHYVAPGALPRVEPASIWEDLNRRDFAINAIAVNLANPLQGEVIDPHDGIGDLRSQAIRVLHLRSFWDDPTRLFRAVRLEQRLGFSVERETLASARSAILEGVLDKVSGDRIRNEFVLLCDEPQIVVSVFRRLGELGVLRSLLAEFRLTQSVEELLHRVESAADRLTTRSSELTWQYWLVVLMALTSEVSDSGRVLLADRLGILGSERSVLLSGGPRAVQLLGILGQTRTKLIAHQVSEILRPCSVEELLFLSALGNEEVAEWVYREIQEFRPLELTIDGSDLIEHGCVPGPELGRALGATRDARLDGTIEAEDELSFAISTLTSGNEMTPN